MRTLTALLLMAAATQATAASPGTSSLEWIAGCWVAPGAEGGTGEHWTPAAGGVMFGVSRTIRNGRLAAFEFMQFRESADGLVFIAQPSGAAPTTFTMKRLTADEVMFENPAHDFPQRVIYRRAGDGLVARIEGRIDGKLQGIDYPLRRMACEEYFRSAAPAARPDVRP